MLHVIAIIGALVLWYPVVDHIDAKSDFVYWHTVLIDIGIGKWFVTVLVLTAFFVIAVIGARASKTVNDKAQVILVAIAGSVSVFAYIWGSFGLYLLDGTRGLNEIFGMIFHVPFLFIGVPLIIYSILYSFLYFLIAIYVFFVPSPKSAVIAERHAKTSRPSHVVEKELANAVESGLASDAELERLIKELPAHTRFFHTLTYKRDAEKYRKVRRMAEAQEKAINERNKMAESAHQLERAKRAREDD